MENKDYKTPRAKVVEVNLHCVLCQSPETGTVTVDGYTERRLDW